VPNELIAKSLRDLGLEAFDFGALKLDHTTGVDVDQVIVVCGWRRLIARAPVEKRMPLDDPLTLKPFYGPVNGREVDGRIPGHHALMQLVHVGVVGRLG
jgi:hypothetical protein